MYLERKPLPNLKPKRPLIIPGQLGTVKMFDEPKTPQLRLSPTVNYLKQQQPNQHSIYQIRHRK
jgi:hypothetical protein